MRPRFEARRLRRSVGVFLVVAPLLAGIGLRVRVNTTESAPRGLYLLTSPMPKRGSWVVVCLPEEVGHFGRVRGYLPAGTCPGGAGAALKQVAAVTGDRVQVGEEGLAVGGALLPGTGRQATDRLGRPVPALPPGSYRVAAGEVWVVSTGSPRSWDSRYFGPVSEVLAGAVPLLIEGSRSPREVR